MSERANGHPGTDEFYVGYLPVPVRQRMFLRFILPAILWLTVAIAAFTAARMRDAGAGVWDTSERRVFVGTLDASPYPILRQAREVGAPADSPLGSFLLVEAGKLGGRAGLGELQGRTIRIAGSILRTSSAADAAVISGRPAKAAGLNFLPDGVMVAQTTLTRFV